MFVSKYFAIALISYFFLYLASSSKTILKGFSSALAKGFCLKNGEFPEFSAYENA